MLTKLCQTLSISKFGILEVYYLSSRIQNKRKTNDVILSVFFSIILLTAGNLGQFSASANVLLSNPDNNFTDQINANSTYSIMDSEKLNTTQSIETNSNYVNLADARLGSLTLPFIENLGQSDSSVRYYADTFAGRIYVTNNSIVYPSTNGLTEYPMTHNLMHVGGTNKSNTNVSIFVGDDPLQWKSDVPTFNVVTFGNVWNGISMDLSAHGNNVEKIFTVSPHADVSQIKLSFDGIDSLSLDLYLRLVLSTKDGQFIFERPIAYQYINGNKVFVPVQYSVSDSEYGFSVGQYDENYDLVIDPIIQSTYLGGTGSDIMRAVTTDSSGNVYVAGETTSNNLPNRTGGAQSAISTTLSSDFLVSVLTPNLKSIAQSTYWGSSSNADRARGIAIDSSGNVYVTGEVANNFPSVSGGAQSTHGGGTFDFGVVKFNKSLKQAIQATYVGGSGSDTARAIAIDSSGNVYVAGETSSSNFLNATGTTQTANGGGKDFGIVKLNSGLTSITKGTYFGGSGDDVANALTLDSSGNVYVAGQTTSSNLPGVTGGIQTSHGGGTDDFALVKLNSALTSRTQATYLGGSGSDVGLNLNVDSTNVYVSGSTASSDFPGTTNAAQSSNGGSVDFVISKLNLGLTRIVQSTYLGGSGSDTPNGMTIYSGNIIIVGQTTSSNFPSVSNGAQTSNGGGTDGVLAKLSFDLTLNVTRTPDDDLAISDSVSISTTKLSTFSDSMTMTDTISEQRSTSVSFADALSITDTTTASKAKSSSVSDSLSISDTITTSRSATKSVSDTLGINDTISTTKSKLTSLSDAMSITDTVRATRSAIKSISDALSITDTISIVRAKLVSLSDSLSITQSTSTTKEEGATLGPTVVVARIIAPNKIVVEFNKNITSTLGSYSGITIAGISETASAHSVIGKYVTLTISPNVTAGQTGQMTLASTIKSLFNISYDTTNNPVPIVNNLGSDPVVLNSTQKTLAFTVNNSPVTKVFIKDGTDSKFDLSVVPNKVTANSRTNVTTNNQLDITFGSGTSNQIDFRLPANLTISGPSANFTGLIDFPERQSTGSCPPKFEGTDSVVSCVDVGKYGVELTLNKPARLVLKGEGAHSPYYGVTPSVLRTKITTQCNADDFNTVSSQISSSGTVRECYIVSGDDMVIWTTHFTSYGTIRAGSSSSSTSNGTSGSSPGSGPINVDVTDLIRSDNYDPDGFGSGISLIVHSIEYDKKTNHVTVILSTSAPPANVMIQGGTQRYSAGLESIQPYLEQRKLVYSANLPDSTSMTILVMDKRDHLSYKVLINQDHYFVSYYNPGYEKYLKKFQTVPEEPEEEIITDAKEQYFKQTEIRLKQLTNTYNEQQMHIFLKTLSKQFTEEQMKVLEQVLDKYN
ncbi:MAG: hypothetical protein EB154_07580 [Nitrosopumilaceae archaeon]|nr:hypothetical protein [Nitrosopumilaceae archaeon]